MMATRATITNASFGRFTSFQFRLSRQKRWHASAPPPPSPASSTHVGPKSFIIGSVAGLLGSLAGMGGGFIMTSSLLRLTQHQAHGTSLFAVAATGVAGALGYGDVDIEAAAAIAACGMVTARVGASATTKISERALKRALGVFMLMVAPTVPAKTYLVPRSETPKEKKADRTLGERILAPAIIGMGSGFLAGLFGVGGGAVVVPALTVFTDMTHYQALATSLSAMCLPAIVGTATHFGKGNVAMHVAPTLALGSFVGAYFGGKLGLHINENALRWGFSGLMVVLGTKMLIHA